MEQRFPPQPSHREDPRAIRATKLNVLSRTEAIAQGIASFVIKLAPG
jgi:hypothetical protein